MAECLLPKQNVAGSNPVSRSNDQPDSAGGAPTTRSSSLFVPTQVPTTAPTPASTPSGSGSVASPAASPSGPSGTPSGSPSSQEGVPLPGASGEAIRQASAGRRSWVRSRSSLVRGRRLPWVAWHSSCTWLPAAASRVSRRMPMVDQPDRAPPRRHPSAHRPRFGRTGRRRRRSCPDGFAHPSRRRATMMSAGLDPFGDKHHVTPVSCG